MRRTNSFPRCFSRHGSGRSPPLFPCRSERPARRTLWISPETCRPRHVARDLTFYPLLERPRECPIFALSLFFTPTCRQRCGTVCPSTPQYLGVSGFRHMGGGGSSCSRPIDCRQEAPGDDSDRRAEPATGDRAALQGSDLNNNRPVVPAPRTPHPHVESSQAGARTWTHHHRSCGTFSGCAFHRSGRAAGNKCDRSNLTSI